MTKPLGIQHSILNSFSRFLLDIRQSCCVWNFSARLTLFKIPQRRSVKRDRVASYCDDNYFRKQKKRQKTRKWTYSRRCLSVNYCQRNGGHHCDCNETKWREWQIVGFRTSAFRMIDACQIPSSQYTFIHIY